MHAQAACARARSPSTSPHAARVALLQGPEAYEGALDLPNGKALSDADLAAFQAHHAGGFMQAVKRARDTSLISGMNFVAASAFAGAGLRLAIARRMPTNCFTVLIVLALAVSSFYTYLDINVPASFKSTDRSALAVFVCSFLARLAICIPIASRVVTSQQFLWVLLFIVPPALTAPVSSILWGGGKYLAVAGSILLYLSVPAVLGVLPYAPGYIYDNKSMTLFYVVLGAGLIAPAGAAQLWRKRSPVEAAKHRKEWSFLSVWALIILSFLACYQVTPSKRDASILKNMFYPFEQPRDSLECERNFFQGVLVYAAMKGFTAAARKLLVYYFNMPADACMDMYILHTNPNIFLWLGLANSIRAPDVTYTKFWGVLLFFLWPAVEQNFIVKSFMHKLVGRTTQSKHISMEQMEVVWKVLQGVGAVSLDESGEEALDQEGVEAFASYVQQITTGILDEKAPVHVARTLFETLDTDRSGFVTKGELYNYVSSVGLVIDLNGSREARKDVAEVHKASTTRISAASADAAGRRHSSKHLTKAQSVISALLANTAPKGKEDETVLVGGTAVSAGRWKSATTSALSAMPPEPPMQRISVRLPRASDLAPSTPTHAATVEAVAVIVEVPHVAPAPEPVQEQPVTWKVPEAPVEEAAATEEAAAVEEEAAVEEAEAEADAQPSTAGGDAEAVAEP